MDQDQEVLHQIQQVPQMKSTHCKWMPYKEEDVVEADSLELLG